MTKVVQCREKLWTRSGQASSGRTLLEDALAHRIQHVVLHLRLMNVAGHSDEADESHRGRSGSRPMPRTELAGTRRCRRRLIARNRIRLLNTVTWMGEERHTCALKKCRLTRGDIGANQSPVRRLTNSRGADSGVECFATPRNVRCSKISGVPAPLSKPKRSRIAVFENIQDHTNLGAAFRSAAAIGVGAVLITPQCVDPLYRRAIRVSMGTVFQVPWVRVESWPEGIDQLKDAGYVVAGMTLGEGAITLDELVAEDHQNLALVFGNEGYGLTVATDALVDRRVTIPMMGGVDSLNVTTSAAVALYATR